MCKRQPVLTDPIHTVKLSLFFVFCQCLDSDHCVLVKVCLPLKYCIISWSSTLGRNIMGHESLRIALVLGAWVQIIVQNAVCPTYPNTFTVPAGRKGITCFSRTLCSNGNSSGLIMCHELYEHTPIIVSLLCENSYTITHTVRFTQLNGLHPEPWPMFFSDCLDVKRTVHCLLALMLSQTIINYFKEHKIWILYRSFISKKIQCMKTSKLRQKAA